MRSQRSPIPLRVDRRTSREDRRAAPRYPSKGAHAFLEWEDGGEVRRIPARLGDISMGGLSASVDSFPPGGAAVRVRLDDPRSPPVETLLIATITKGLFAWTRRSVRLRFLEPCPYEFFKAAIEGFYRE